MRDHLKRLRLIADYQFGPGAGEGMFPEDVDFTVSSRGRVRQAFIEGKRLVTLRSRDGLLTLGMLGALRLHACLPFPERRVVAVSDAVPFVSDGKTLFAKHVSDADKNIKAREEVLVVDGEDNLIATGTAVLGGSELLTFERGMGVKVRESINKINKEG